MSEHFDVTDPSMDFDATDPTIVRWVVNQLRGRLRDTEKRIATLDALVRDLRGQHEEGDDDVDWPAGDYCPDCGIPESHCICDDPEKYCRSCGRVSDCIDGGLCGMCFEMQGGVLLPGQ